MRLNTNFAKFDLGSLIYKYFFINLSTEELSLNT